MRGGILFFFLLSYFANAVDVAFLVRRNPAGQIEVYESGGRYAHVALRVGSKWLHAHTWRGVELADNLDDMGEITEILNNSQIAEPDPEFIDNVLGKKFHVFADWENPEVFNCTKLVATYLGIAPQPMSFDPLIWGIRFAEFKGKPGLSPDELRTEMSKEQYRPLKLPCKLLLRQSANIAT